MNNLLSSLIRCKNPFLAIYSWVLNQQQKILNNTDSHACIYGNDVS